MNRDLLEMAKKFIHEHAKTKFYQPVVFMENVLEIQGKWHHDTKNLANIILNDVQNKSILDVGCNCGYFLHEAKKRECTMATGIDHDIVSVNLAEEISDILNDDIKIEHVDLQNYVPGNRYDIILMLSVLHVLKNPRQEIIKYLNYAKDKVIIEYSLEEKYALHDLCYEEIVSPRAAGSKYIAILSKHLNNQVAE